MVLISKAAKRAAALNKEEFEFIVNALVEEGYDLSSYTWDEMYDVCLDEICQLDEGAAGDVAARAQKLANQKKGQTPERKKMYQGLADKASARERGPFRGGTVRKNMTSADRDASRESDAYHSSVFGERSKINQHGDSTYGPGGKPKGKKAERQKSRGVSAESFDLYDIILSHLIAEGYADTNESALVIMANMSEEWRQSIVEVKLDPRGRPASGPMNVYKQSKPNNDPAFQAALKSVRDADAKKTPEQRKAELDAYKERQMNR
jgi:hypothetical protein